MWKFIEDNANTIITSLSTLLGMGLVQWVGHRISLENQKAATRKTDTEAADSVRDDLMKQVEEANKRIDKKDEIIDDLNSRILALEKTNLELRWESYIKTSQIEQLQRQLTALEESLKQMNEKLKEAGYGK